MSLDTLEIISNSVEETIAIGSQLGALLLAGDVVCLAGDLGAGKTAFMIGIGKGWGAWEPVNSPTFVFVHEHHHASDDTRLYHLDCYRLSSEADAISIGLDDILAGRDVVVLEWPERVNSFLPSDCLWVDLQPLDNIDQRRLTFRAMGQRTAKLLTDLKSVLN
ncbi:MAG: tRNA (adenosine(37)-N6)-threonylcarbamoyltransferase complex ATPase subunit type 1 TsaE [Chloroflexota bacterium]